MLLGNLVGEVNGVREGVSVCVCSYKRIRRGGGSVQWRLTCYVDLWTSVDERCGRCNGRLWKRKRHWKTVDILRMCKCTREL